MPVRVLLVDDEPQILATLRRLLTRRGYEVSTACDSEDALTQLPVFLPHVVISDFKLPGLNGAQLLAKVARLLPSARGVLLSGFAEVGGEDFDGPFLRKPWSETELLSHCALGALT